MIHLRYFTVWVYMTTVLSLFWSTNMSMPPKMLFDKSEIKFN